MDDERQPPIVEVKERPDGTESRYECRLALLEQTACRTVGVLRYRIRQEMRVAGVDIPAGTVSYGCYWSDRNYNVYVWLGGEAAESETPTRTAQRGQPEGVTPAPIGYYVNVGDRPRLAVEEFRWRDLWLDVVVLPNLRARVLDRDEVPEDLDPATGRVIDRTIAEVLGDRRRVLDDCNSLITRCMSA